MRITRFLQQKYLISLLCGVLGGILVLGSAQLLEVADTYPAPGAQALPAQGNLTAHYAAHTSDRPADFVQASKMATPAVVHIKSSMATRRSSDYNREDLLGPFREFFEEPFRNYGPRASSGSGVILSPDGYIVTNNHVIDDAAEVEVVLYDNRTYKASVIGTDPSTDLALLKIDEGSLPYLQFGDSDQLEVGEWVLALGNPFNLTSTVTAGIVSAKARNINILSDRFKVESFIQTDAAVNPGNSGGALINTRGELVGINTAIASRTGSYSGYSFAVPSRLAEKVVEDLKEYGAVQRGFLGVMIQDVNADLDEDKDLGTTRGVYIASVNENSAAEDAGLLEGDVVLEVDGEEVLNSAELQEQISRHRPGDEVTLKVLRDGELRMFTVTLKNRSGNTRYVTRERVGAMESAGVDLEKIDRETKDEADVRHGVQVTRLYPGKFRSAGIREGFIITHIDKEPVYSPEDVIQNLEGRTGAVLIEGVTPDGRREAYAVMF